MKNLFLFALLLSLLLGFLGSCKKYLPPASKVTLLDSLESSHDSTTNPSNCMCTPLDSNFILYANFPESWEEETLVGDRIGGYMDSATETFNSGEWIMQHCYTMKSKTLLYETGEYALLMQANDLDDPDGRIVALTMGFDLTQGVSRLSFEWGIATTGDQGKGTEAPVGIKVEYSQDEGVTWQQLDNFTIDDGDKHTADYDDLDFTGPVRFRISKLGYSARITIDEIAMYHK